MQGMQSAVLEIKDQNILVNWAGRRHDLKTEKMPA